MAIAFTSFLFTLLRRRFQFAARRRCAL